MTAIGGYFELELKKGEHYHKNALKLNTARNCFEYILRSRGYKRIYMPYYTCEVMFQPLNKLKIEFAYYHINEKFEIVEPPILKEGEAILYTNYFALKQSYIEKLSIQYSNRLIVDNAQAFYAPRIEGIDTFYSARKFFGVPDGAYLYTDSFLDEELEQDISYDRALHLLKRIDLSAEDGYEDFRKADDSLDNQPIRLMSKLTECILCSIDYDVIANQRKVNFAYLSEHFKDINIIDTSADLACMVPFSYPLMIKDSTMRIELISNKIYVPTYWQNVFNVSLDNSYEYKLAQNILSLPVDQRYNITEISKIVKIIKL